MTKKEWIAEARKRFGKDTMKWKFKCVACGNIQSIESVMERNKDLKSGDCLNWIYFACEGRHTEDVGCNWTLGGLLHIHTLEVTEDGHKPEPVFEFADEAEEDTTDEKV
jgi:hypothetical protein